MFSNFGFVVILYLKDLKALTFENVSKITHQILYEFSKLFYTFSQPKCCCKATQGDVQIVSHITNLKITYLSFLFFPLWKYQPKCCCKAPQGDVQIIFQITNLKIVRSFISLFNCKKITYLLLLFFPP